MKKLLFMILLSTAFILSACTNDSPDKSGAQDSPLAETIGQFTQGDLIFTIDGAGFALDSDIAPLMEILGDDYTLTSAPSCVYEGEDKTFDYGDIIIYTYPMDERDVIWEIDIIGEGYSTGKKIKVGDTIEDINAAYGENGFYVGNSYIFNISQDEDDIESPQLCFDFNDDKVSCIIFYSPSNLT